MSESNNHGLLPGADASTRVGRVKRKRGAQLSCADEIQRESCTDTAKWDLPLGMGCEVQSNRELSLLTQPRFQYQGPSVL
jgi:hypothetical protein